TEGARLLREKRVQGRPRRRKGAEETPGPPAESECLERKATFKLNKPLKPVDKLDYLYPLKKSITIAKTITPISNNGPMPELYTKYTVMWRKVITIRNRSNRIHKIMIRAVFLFRYNVTSSI
ncbi:hypothetical protein P4534_18065, partial [Peribacillus butanolivorans]|uniref:hypothetical protein n=1 Tax=Peribacillus butanolivorans TaxID=421767 RepID=UPI002E2144BE|nr:hypothetical protein [Peribacillus butanolivorans]